MVKNLYCRDGDDYCRNKINYHDEDSVICIDYLSPNMAQLHATYSSAH